MSSLKMHEITCLVISCCVLKGNEVAGEVLEVADGVSSVKKVWISLRTTNIHVIVIDYIALATYLPWLFIYLFI